MQLNDLDSLIQILNSFKESPLGSALTWIAPAVAATATGLFAISSIALKWRHSQNDKKSAKKLLQAAQTNAFTEEDFRRARQYYIEQDGGNLDPANSKDFLSALSVTSPMYHVLDTELNKGNFRHVIIFADSGMGKTTLLLNYYARECKKRKGRRIAIISLSRPTALDDLEKITDKNETTLFLDAFDEDPKALHNHQSRLKQIMIAASDFQKIIITCRTQFFENDQAIPVSTGIWRAGSRSVNESAMHEFRRIYLMPFDQKKCEQYIKLRIPKWRPTQRRTALRYIESLHDLPMRPMLLEQIPDLAKAKAQVKSLFGLYEFMVESWYQREKEWISNESLKACSLAIAIHLMNNRNNLEANALTAQEIDRVLLEADIHIEPSERWALRTRSLLNRDATGQIKFAHRTILEYFFVLSLIEGNKRALETSWTDHSATLLKDWFTHASSAEIERITKTIKSANIQASGLIPLNTPAPNVSKTINGLEFETLEKTPKAFKNTSESVKFIDAFIRTRFVEIKVNEEILCRVARIYNLALGAIYTIPYDLNRTHQSYAHAWNVSWESIASERNHRENLPPINYLGRILHCVDSIFGITSYFSRYDLYWLGNGEYGLRYAFRLQKTTHPPIKLGTNFELDFTSRLSEHKNYRIEVYRVLNPQERAICVSVCFAQAEQLWEEEASDLGWAEEYIRQYTRVRSKQVQLSCS